MAAIAMMVKPKKKQVREEVVGEMELDKIVASPAQMKAAAKEEAAELAKKKAKYAATAMKAISGFKGNK